MPIQNYEKLDPEQPKNRQRQNRPSVLRGDATRKIGRVKLVPVSSGWSSSENRQSQTDLKFPRRRYSKIRQRQTASAFSEKRLLPPTYAAPSCHAVTASNDFPGSACSPPGADSSAFGPLSQLQWREPISREILLATDFLQSRECAILQYGHYQPIPRGAPARHPGAARVLWGHSA